MLDHVHHLAQIGTGVEQTQRAFECIGMRAFLNHRGAFAIVFAHHNQCATHHAGGSKVGECI